MTNAPEDLALEPLLEELKAIRRSGYAKSDGTWTMGIMSYAAPILGHGGRAAAAMSVTAPRERMTPEKELNVVESLLHICAKIAETVGRL